jgi:hypothetical protein
MATAVKGEFEADYRGRPKGWGKPTGTLLLSEVDCTVWARSDLKLFGLVVAEISGDGDRDAVEGYVGWRTRTSRQIAGQDPILGARRPSRQTNSARRAERTRPVAPNEPDAGAPNELDVRRAERTRRRCAERTRRPSRRTNSMSWPQTNPTPVCRTNLACRAKRTRRPCAERTRRPAHRTK